MKPPAKIGVWMIGARGGLATTIIVGARACLRGLAPPTGMFTLSPDTGGLDCTPLENLVFGGHEIRKSSLRESALEIYRETGVLRHDHLLELESDLEEVDREIRPGTSFHCGTAIERLSEEEIRPPDSSPISIVERIASDLMDFRNRHSLESVIVVNLASTEPAVTITDHHRDPAKLETLLETGGSEEIRASSLYALAAIREGFPFINFTPSNGFVLPALLEMADARGIPYMGSDGKTGETLVKSALAPMFRYRSLRVLSWQGYNILGDRDGAVLADPKNKESKVRTKDEAIQRILGYPVHTHVGIDYVPSLHDQKTAWDFIHFEGFLGVKMSLQFIWQGHDSILAAPVVLDLVRFVDLARRRGESGPMRHLSCYFKKPLGAGEHDLHFQFHSLMDYVSRTRAGSPEKRSP